MSAEISFFLNTNLFSFNVKPPDFLVNAIQKLYDTPLYIKSIKYLLSIWMSKISLECVTIRYQIDC